MKPLAPVDNKFHVGNGSDAKHYWLTPPELYEQLNLEFGFDFDPCPHPKPETFDGLTCDWGKSSYVNPPFGSIMHEGKKKGPTAWARKAIAEQAKGNRVVMVYPIDKWVLLLLAAGAQVRNLGDVRWLATEDGTAGKGTGRHIACFVLDPPTQDTAVMRDDAEDDFMREYCETADKQQLANTCWRLHVKFGQALLQLDLIIAGRDRLREDARRYALNLQWIDNAVEGFKQMFAGNYTPQIQAEFKRLQRNLASFIRAAALQTQDTP